MKAIALTHYLPSDHPDCFIEANLADPTPGPRDLLERVNATSINPVDTKVRAPKAKVEPRFQLSEAEIRKFYTQGFLGPFDAFSQEEMADFKKEVLALEKTKSKTYGFVTPRDRHFESPRLWSYMTCPAITERWSMATSGVPNSLSCKLGSMKLS